MNLLEFKKFCLLRQNYDYAFIEDSSFTTNEDVHIGPVVIERPESNLVVIKYSNDFNIQSWMEVVDSVKAKLNSNQTLNLVGNINIIEFNSTGGKMNSFTQVSKLGLYVDYTVALSCSKELITFDQLGSVSTVDTQSGSWFNNLTITNKVKLVLAEAEKCLAILPQIIISDAGMVVADPLDLTLNSNNKNELKALVKNTDSINVEVGNLGQNQFKSIILNKDSENIESNSESNFINQLGFNVARLATLADYKDNTLSELNNYWDINSTLFDLKYYIIQ